MRDPNLNFDPPSEVSTPSIHEDQESFEEHFQHVQKLVEFWLCTGSDEEKKAELISIKSSMSSQELEQFLGIMNLDHLIYLMDEMPLIDCFKVIDDLTVSIVDQDKEAEVLELLLLRVAFIKTHYIERSIVIDPINFPASSKIAKCEVFEKFIGERVSDSYKIRRKERLKSMLKPSQLAELSAFLYYGFDSPELPSMLAASKKLINAFGFDFSDQNIASTLNNLKNRFRMTEGKEDWSFIERMLIKAKEETGKLKVQE